MENLHPDLSNQLYFRATRENVCICIAMSRRNSIFIKEYYKHIIFNLPGANSPLLQLFTRFLGQFVKDTLVRIKFSPNYVFRVHLHLATITAAGNQFGIIWLVSCRQTIQHRNKIRTFVSFCSNFSRNPHCDKPEKIWFKNLFCYFSKCETKN